MDEVIYVPPWAKQEHYSRLMEALEGRGYRADPRCHAEDELERRAYEQELMKQGYVTRIWMGLPRGLR